MASVKKGALTALQVAVTVGLLWFVFRDPKLRAEIGAALAHANYWWLAAGLVVYSFVELIAGVRWQLLLRVQGIFLGWIRLLTLMMIGIFFNFFVPGGTGGDVVKVFYLLKETPGRGAQAFLSVLVDRIIGVLSLVLISSVVLTLRWNWLMSSPEDGAIRLADARRAWLSGGGAAGFVSSDERRARASAACPVSVTGQTRGVCPRLQSLWSRLAHDRTGGAALRRLAPWVFYHLLLRCPGIRRARSEAAEPARSLRGDANCEYDHIATDQLRRNRCA
jgi:hypothetical protein